MSQIAQALAKAKERAAQTTAPFLQSGAGPSAASAATLRKAKNTRVFWRVLVGVALPLTAFILWTRLAPKGAAHKVGELATAHSTDLGSSHKSAPSGTTPGVSTAQSHANAAPPRPELMAAVAALPISAVIPGDPARILLEGRVVRAGEVVEGQLVFADIVDDQLRFTDARGAIYTRRY
jgi:hypothetical protein